jgi:radical SAM domain protein
MYKSVQSLVYVPNSYCNFGCKYCYLGKLTDNKTDYSKADIKLKNILDSYDKSGVLLKDISFHGAEVTTLPLPIFDKLCKVCYDYHKEHELPIKFISGDYGQISIKTNLYRYDKVAHILNKYNVFVSCSIDLPFSHHREFRVLKDGSDTFNKVYNNLILLNKNTNGKFVMSCTIGIKALEHIDEFIKDIEHLDSIGIDMCKCFYIMFIYDSAYSKVKTGMTDEEQGIFFDKLLDHFKGTKFEQAIYYSWFREFPIGYCTNEANCGRNNYLVQKNGDVYPCHRGQAVPELKFGNILQDSFEDITKTGTSAIANYDNNNLPLHNDCLECNWFHYCNMGCPISRRDINYNKSYTCTVQRKLYKAQPERFPEDPIASAIARDSYIKTMMPNYYYSTDVPKLMKNNPEFYDSKNSLESIILRDKLLMELYNPSNIKLGINGEYIDLFSSLLNDKTMSVTMYNSDDLKLFLSNDYVGINHTEDNNILLMILSKDTVVYGDEQRTKMQHLEHIEIELKDCIKVEEGYLVDLHKVLESIKDKIPREDMWYEMFVTTKDARRYHYDKHSKNAFYHIETINLPFHSFFFSYK